MASRKLTVLPTATEVTTSDKIYIVDVSDTTESPQGTSKQATVEKVVGYKELVMLYTSTGELDNGTFTILKQDEGFGTITVERSGNQVSFLSTLSPFTENKVYINANFVGDDSAQGFFWNSNYEISSVTFSILDYTTAVFLGALGNGSSLKCTILIQVFP